MAGRENLRLVGLGGSGARTARVHGTVTSRAETGLGPPGALQPPRMPVSLLPRKMVARSSSWPCRTRWPGWRKRTGTSLQRWRTPWSNTNCRWGWAAAVPDSGGEVWLVFQGESGVARVGSWGWTGGVGGCACRLAG